MGRDLRSLNANAIVRDWPNPLICPNELLPRRGRVRGTRRASCSALRANRLRTPAPAATPRTPSGTHAAHTRNSGAILRLKRHSKNGTFLWLGMRTSYLSVKFTRCRPRISRETICTCRERCFRRPDGATHSICAHFERKLRSKMMSSY